MIKVNFNAEVDKAQAQRILAEIKKDAMGGWLELPKKYDMGEIARIKEAAAKIDRSMASFVRMVLNEHFAKQ